MTLVRRVAHTARAGQRWLLAASVTVLGFLAAASPLVRGRLAPFGDADGFFSPYYTLVADFARAGRLLLWNPWTNGGSPDYIEPQVGALSPFVVVSAAITGGGELGYRLHWLAIWLLGALGILVLARRFKTPPAVAVAVALGFALSGPFVGNAQHLSWVYTFALLPWALWRLDVALEGRRPLAAVQAGAMWGLSALGGYPGVVLITGGVLVLWVGGRWFAARRPGDELPGEDAVATRTAVRSVALLLVVGALVMLPTVAPILVEGRGFSDRAGVLPRDEAITSNAWHPRAVSTLASPYLGTLPPPRLWPDTDLSSATVYMGAVPLLLAVYALVARPRDRLRWWLLGGAVLLGAVAVGPALPLRGWLYDFVPPTRYFRHATMFRLGSVFLLTLLALGGGRDLVRGAGGARRWQPLVTAAAIAAAAVAAYAAIVSMVDGPHPARALRHLLVVWLGVVAIGAVAALATSRRRRVALLVVIPVIALVDARLSFQLANTVGRPAAEAGWDQLDATRRRTLDAPSPERPRLPIVDDSTDFGPGPTAKNLLAKVAALNGYTPLTSDALVDLARVPAFSALAVRRERVFFATDAVATAPTKDALAVFGAGMAERGTVPLVVHERSSMADLNRAGATRPSLAADLAGAPAVATAPVRWREYRPDSIAFTVTAPDDGWLLVTERWARGWRATVDGEAVDVSAGDFVFRALRIPRGAHAVTMTYRPFGYPWLLLPSWGGLALVAGATIYAGSRRLRSRRITHSSAAART